MSQGFEVREWGGRVDRIMECSKQTDQSSHSGRREDGSDTHHPALDPRVLWDSLVTDSGAQVVVWDLDGRFLFVNDHAAQRMGTTAGSLIGRLITDVFPGRMGEERLGLVRQACKSDRPLRVEGVTSGHSLRTVLRCMGDGDARRVLAVTLHGSAATVPGGPDQRYEPVQLLTSDAGVLERLSRRQLEVLRLIGEGNTDEQIAARLGIAVKTVTAHRGALARRLGKSGRLELARFALERGLASVPPPRPDMRSVGWTG